MIFDEETKVGPQSTSHLHSSHHDARFLTGVEAPVRIQASRITRRRADVRGQAGPGYVSLCDSEYLLNSILHRSLRRPVHKGKSRQEGACRTQ